MSYGNSWAYGLIDAIKDKRRIIFRSETIVCINDLYAKARHHFLIIPEERPDLDNIFDLRKNDIELIKEMQLMGINAIELVGNKIENFRIGFHIQPSMKRLHLHVVSKDFDSPCLKHKKHWNSFNTDFLMQPSTVIECLEQNGEVTRPSETLIKQLINTPLQCNSCKYIPKNIPDLKKHLITHGDLYKGMR